MVALSENPTGCAPTPHDVGLTRLAAERRCGLVDPAQAAPVDRGRGARVASRPRHGVARRALPGSAAALIGEARRDGAGAIVEVWGPAATPDSEAETALAITAAWAGLCDDAAGFAEACAASPVTRRLYHEIGDVVLGRLPSVGEALGRAVIAQLVQGVEAARSTAQLVARAGTPAPDGLRCWPAPAQVRAQPPHALRRCGISLAGAKALHAAAIEDPRLQRAVRAGWEDLEARLCALPGVGPWTAAETRLALGDPDAVSVGDYHLASVVGTALTGEQRRREEWTDAEMLALLEPFAGQRGRVVRLCELAAARRLVPRPRRIAPRARLSAHRYW
jgi:3-methyladenine DNA glycosylase/8-oxoguanine DNA glycosylase